MTPPADRTGRDDTEGGGDAVHAPHAADAPADGRQAHAADVFLAGQDPADAERVATHHREMDRLGAEVRGEGEI